MMRKPKRDDGLIEVEESRARKQALLAMLHLGKIEDAIKLVESSVIIEVKGGKHER